MRRPYEMRIGERAAENLTRMEDNWRSYAQPSRDDTDKIFQIAAGPPGTKLCIATLTAALYQGASATADIWSGNGGSESDSTESITVWDWLMNVGDPAMVTGIRIVCAQINGNWYVIAASCPTS